MPKKALFPILGLVTVLFIIYALFPRNNDDSRTTGMLSEHAVDSQDVASKVNHIANLRPESKTGDQSLNQKSRSDTNPATSNEPVKVTTTDLYGRDSRFTAPTAQHAKSLLDQRAAIDPDKEFDSLALADFRDEQTKMFSGSFEDQDKHIQLEISSIMFPASTPVSFDSCIIMGSSKQTNDDGKRIVVKDDRSGYAAMLIDKRWYVKMAYAFPKNRTIFGKIYERKQGEWVYLHDFAAEEVRGKKIECDTANK